MKALFRASAFFAILLAFVVLVIDGATIISAKSFMFTGIDDLIVRFSPPGALDRLAKSISANGHPLLWSMINLLLLKAPAVIVLSIVSLLFWLAGRQNEPDLVLHRRD